MAARRIKGEGSLHQRHDHPTCPEVDGGERPAHRCRGTWIATHDMGWVAGKRVRKIARAKTRAEARDKLAALQARYPTGSTVDQHRRTVEQWMGEYLTILGNDDKTRPQTLKGYRSKTKTCIVPLLGKLRLDQVDAAHLDAMFAALKKPCPEQTAMGNCPSKHLPSHQLSESSRRQVFMILRRAFKIAMRRRLIDRNPCDMVDPPGTQTTDTGRLTVAEARRVLEVADDEANDFNPARWWAALFLGMRQGEALGLRLRDVDLGEDLLYVRQTLQQDHDNQWVLDRPKSPRSVRAIPMPTSARTRFAVQVAHRRAQGAGDDDVLFTGATRWYVVPWEDSPAWHALLDAAEVPQVQLRAARSTAGSLLADAGVPPRLVSEILGHTDVLFTQNTYVKGDLDGRRAAMVALETHYTGA